ncbi:MAG: phosphotransferase family protein [Burkholderiaceae bacterium]
MTDLTPGLEPWVVAAVEQAVRRQPELAGARLTAAQRLSGGAINQNFLVTLVSETAGPFRWVMRRSQSQAIPGSHDRSAEFDIIRYAHALGVKVPAPVAVVAREGQMASFFGYVPGDADARRLVSFLGERQSTQATTRDFSQTGIRPSQVVALTESLGEQLGRLHRGQINAGHSPADLISVLGPMPQDSIQASLSTVERAFARLSRPAQYLRFAVQAILNDRPARVAQRRPGLCHNDFRLGNLMILLPQNRGQTPVLESAADFGLSAVLDWEFADWGDPMADIGWLTAPCWRFGGAMPVAGFGALEDLLRGYYRENPEPLPLDELPFWQRLAHVRWGIIAAQQAERVVFGDPESVELLITGAMTASIVKPVVEHYLGETVPPCLMPEVSAELQGVDQWLAETSLLLKKQLAPGLSSSAKYQALMAANALRLARARLRSESSGMPPSENLRQELARDLAVWSFKD